MGDRADDPATPLDDLWGEMKTPILYFGNAHMPADWLLNGIYSAQKSGSPDVAINVLEGYGHLDVVVGENARSQVYEPTLAWIKGRAEERRSPGVQWPDPARFAFPKRLTQPETKH